MTIAACAVVANLAGPAMAQATATTKLSKADASYLMKDAQGSAYELASAKLAAEKAARDDVKSYAQKLVSDHDAYSTALEKLGQDNGLTLPPEMDKADQARLAKLEKLSGAAFDRAYIAEAIRVNAEDERDAEKEKRTTKDESIKGFIGQFSDLDAEHEKIALELKKAKG